MRNLLKRFNAKDENYEVKTNPANLSLGEQQKLFLIRTFMQEKSIVLLDEPSANLDVESKAILRDFLEEEKRKNKRMSIFSIGLFFVGVVTMSTYNSFVNTVPNSEINSASVISADEREALVTSIYESSTIVDKKTTTLNPDELFIFNTQI